MQSQLSNMRSALLLLAFFSLRLTLSRELVENKSVSPFLVGVFLSMTQTHTHAHARFYAHTHTHSRNVQFPVKL